MRLETVKQLGREAKGSSAAITLVLASVLSALAAITNTATWVAVTAAAVAVLSGSQVLWAQLVVPIRIRSAENSSQLLLTRPDGRPKRGTAFQIAPNRWLTAQHVIRDSDETFLKLGNDLTQAEVLYESQEQDVAILSVARTWPWKASISDTSPDSGDRIRVVGWAKSGGPDQSRVRLAFDYVVQGPAENNCIALSGPDHPQIGFSGAPAIDIRSGRVFGFLTQYVRQASTDPWLPEPVALAIITPISSLPAQFRDPRPSTRPSSSDPR